MASRRQVLQALGVGVVATSALAPAAASAASRAASSAPRWSRSAAPWWLLAPCQVGSAVGRGWQLDHLSTVHEGAAVLSLSHRDGRLARVHVCARHGRPTGVAHTALFDLVLMDGAAGDRPTDESLGRVLSQLARRIRRNEQAMGEDQLRGIVGLRSHTDRVDRYGPEALV